MSIFDDNITGIKFADMRHTPGKDRGRYRKRATNQRFAQLKIQPNKKFIYNFIHLSQCLTLTHNKTFGGIVRFRSF